MAATRSLYADLASLYLPIALAVAVLVLGFTSLAVVRGVRRREPAPGAAEHNALEGAYVVVLAAIAAFLVAMTFRTEARVDAATSRAGLAIRVTAAKWRWTFTYPGGVRSAGLLVVPADRPVRFRARSIDVLHDFWVPDRRFQRQVWPDRETAWTLTFPAGVHDGVCAWFCGLDHDQMRFAVRAVPAAEYRAWLERRGGA